MWVRQRLRQQQKVNSGQKGLEGKYKQKTREGKQTGSPGKEKAGAKVINNTIKIKGNRGRNSQMGEEKEAEGKGMEKRQKVQKGTDPVEGGLPLWRLE